MSVIAVGAFVIGPATDAMHAGEGGREGVLIAAAAYDVRRAPDGDDPVRVQAARNAQAVLSPFLPDL